MERQRQRGGGLRCRLRHEDRRRRRLLDHRRRHLLDSRLLGHDLRSPSLLEKKIAKEVSFHFPRLSDPDPNPNSKSSLLSRTSRSISLVWESAGSCGLAGIECDVLSLLAGKTQIVEALDVVHVNKEDQQSVFAMLAAVLWLGHISFIVIDNENHVEAVEDEGLFNVSKLIGCGMDELKLALSTRKMRVGNDNIVQKLTLTQAIDTRDALAKSIYVVAGLAADGRQIVGRTKSEANYESLHDSVYIINFLFESLSQ
ncbi:hypothetical protein ACE6H2_010706 [Prunus campanulata]